MATVIICIQQGPFNLDVVKSEVNWDLNLFMTSVNTCLYLLNNFLFLCFLLGSKFSCSTFLD